jgi:hypothetical protein
MAAVAAELPLVGFFGKEIGAPDISDVIRREVGRKSGA